MKKLQIMIEDNLMKEMKFTALNKGITLKDLVTGILAEHFSKDSYEPKQKQKPVPTAKPKLKQQAPLTPKPIPEPVPEPKKPTYSKTYDFELPETVTLGKPEKDSKQYYAGPFTWLLEEGQCAHYAANGAIIPYRYTDENNNIIEPTEYDMDEIQKEQDKQEERKRQKEEWETDEKPW